ncbi:MAG: DUF5372 family protein [Mycobacteriales bacterium]
MVRVTHQFHPWFGREFEFVTYRHNWGEDRVYFLDEAGALRSLPLNFTDAGSADPFVVMAAGRSPFRVVDLLDLVAAVDRWRAASTAERRKAVKGITPLASMGLRRSKSADHSGAQRAARRDAKDSRGDTP